MSSRGDEVEFHTVRLVIAQCQVDYTGRLTAHLPWAKRLIVVKSDNSVSVHADDRAYKPLNWMSSPCTLTIRPCLPDEPAATAAVDAEEVWEVDAPTGDHLQRTAPTTPQSKRMSLAFFDHGDLRGGSSTPAFDSAFGLSSCEFMVAFGASGSPVRTCSLLSAFRKVRSIQIPLSRYDSGLRSTSRDDPVLAEKLLV